MSKPTPGPWFLHPSNDGSVARIEVAWGERPVAYVESGMPNARLIAAAPDLLNAALLAVSVLGHMAEILGDVEQEPGTVIPQLRAAIAKAEVR